ncbi:hypothetical protein CAEBREN_13055 [Caenorhabditis brenneri]|uniref:Uncharacterized protein n=1 Tax=Caenorhabditis brenneri TaxID=135651 RepID=G0N0B2_CAEBE|nr:hypothetical protein CAEBREN_13055 [Caenorhabditis brenneri]
MAATMNAPRFPLTELPVPCAKNVLQTMSPLQLVVYSLLSKKCKNHVNSINYPTEVMSIQFTQGLAIIIKIKQDILRVGFYEPHTQEEMENKKQLGTPKNVTIAIGRNETVVEECRWTTNQLGVKEWVEHLKFVFPNSNDIWLNFMQRSFRFDLDCVKKIFPNIPKLCIYHTGRFKYNQLILQKLLPTEVISIAPNCFRDSRIPQRILIQNFANVHYAQGPLTRIPLNDLLINNSKQIMAINSQISSKEFNKFLKLWIRGANPRIEFLSVLISDEFTEYISMKGITYQKMQERKCNLGCLKNVTLSGGLDVCRMDGTKATVGAFREDNRSWLIIIVWHDHCIVP